jgi:hypothetical protein
MPRHAFWLLALLSATAVPQDAGGDEPFWRTDLEAARADALRTNRPLLVVFRCER